MNYSFANRIKQHIFQDENGTDTESDKDSNEMQFNNLMFPINAYSTVEPDITNQTTYINNESGDNVDVGNLVSAGSPIKIPSNNSISQDNDGLTKIPSTSSICTHSTESSVVQSRNPSTPPIILKSGSNNSSFSSNPIQSSTSIIPTPSLPFHHHSRKSTIANALSDFVTLKGPHSLSTSKNSSNHTQQSQNTNNGLNNGTDSTTLESLPKPPAPTKLDSFDSYLLKLANYNKFIGIILSQRKSDQTDSTNIDSFLNSCCFYFFNTFFEFNDLPLDLALREFLIFLELPKETQQIDRLLVQFSKSYFEQNQNSFWIDDNQIYLMTFSLLMLHTDHFNSNNKFKMTKSEFINLIHGDDISNGNLIPISLLSYFFDNITAKKSLNLTFDLLTTIQRSYMTTTNFLVYYSPKDIIKDEKLLVHRPVSRTRSNSNTNPTNLHISSHFHDMSPTTSHYGGDNNLDVYLQISKDQVHNFNLLNSKGLVGGPDFIQGFLDYNFSSFQDVDSGIEYDEILTNINHTKIGYLKIYPNLIENFNYKKFEVLNKTKAENSALYFKIIQISSDILVLDNKNNGILKDNCNNLQDINNLWKEKLLILTTAGLWIFEKSDPIFSYTISDTSNNTVTIYNTRKVRSFSLPILLNNIFAFKRFDSIGTLCYSFLLSRANEQKQVITPTPSKKNVREPTTSLANRLSSFASMGSTTPQTGTFSNENVNKENDSISKINMNLYSLSKEHPEKLFFLYGSNKNLVLNCQNQEERDTWVNSVNLLATLNGCHLNLVNRMDNIVIPFRKYTVQDKRLKVKKGCIVTVEEIQKLQKELKLLCQTIPIYKRTEITLLKYVKKLLTKMSWLLYENTKNYTFTQIIEGLESTLYNEGTDSNIYSKEFSNTSLNDSNITTQNSNSNITSLPVLDTNQCQNVNQGQNFIPISNIPADSPLNKYQDTRNLANSRPYAKRYPSSNGEITPNNKADKYMKPMLTPGQHSKVTFNNDFSNEEYLTTKQHEDNSPPAAHDRYDLLHQNSTSSINKYNNPSENIQTNYYKEGNIQYSKNDRNITPCLKRTTSPTTQYSNVENVSPTQYSNNTGSNGNTTYSMIGGNTSPTQYFDTNQSIVSNQQPIIPERRIPPIQRPHTMHINLMDAGKIIETPRRKTKTMNDIPGTGEIKDTINFKNQGIRRKPKDMLETNNIYRSPPIENGGDYTNSSPIHPEENVDNLTNIQYAFGNDGNGQYINYQGNNTTTNADTQYNSRFEYNEEVNDENVYYHDDGRPYTAAANKDIIY